MRPEGKKMKGRKMAALAAVAVIAVVLAAVTVYAVGNDGYSIEYELNGGTQNELNPTSYTKGEDTRLYDAYDEDRVFVSWFLDEGLTQPVDSVSGLSGDITLYAGWSDTPVGKSLEYSVSGSYGSGLLNSYRMGGSVTYTYLYQNDEGEYMMSVSSEMDYRYAIHTQHRSSEDTYWTGESDTRWYEIGTDTISTINGEKQCTVVRGMHSDGSSETQWIADGWIAYRMEYSSRGTFSSATMVYELTDVGNVSTVSEVDVTVYSDMGITVTGGGTYSPGDTVTLTASAAEGTGFSGWYDSDGGLLSDSETYEFTAQYGDTAVYAMNTADPDTTSAVGSSPEGDHTGSTAWSVYGSDGELEAEFTGDPSQYVYGEPGDYTVVYSDTETGEHGIYTVLVDGTVTRTFEWTYDGTDYTCSLDILYSDVRYYREYYDVSERQQDTANDHARDVTFVTSDDKYVRQIASDLTEMSEGMTDLERADFLLAFSQCLGYQDDSVYMGAEEYWKFPLETLYDHGGDCEDTSILLCAIADAMGYDTALLLFPGHMAAGIHVEGTYDDLDGFYSTSDPERKVYYYCETTAEGWSIGRIPSSVDTGRATMVVVP